MTDRPAPTDLREAVAMTDPAVDAIARAIWDAEERVHSPSDPMPWEEGSALSHSPYLRSAQAAIAALRKQDWGPITSEMKAVCEAARLLECARIDLRNSPPGNRIPASAVIRLRDARRAADFAVDALGRALLKEDGK